MPTVRELTTKVGFDGKAAERNAEKFEKALGGVKKAAMAVAAAGAAAATAMFAFAKEAAAAGDAAAKQSRRIGISIEDYQKLAWAAGLSGTSIEEVGDVMKDLAKNAYEASRGQEEFLGYFKEMGVELKDSEGRLRGTKDLFLDVAEGMRTMEDRTRAMAISEKLLGGSGRKMFNLFDQGRDGIRDMMQEADALGIVLSDVTARRSESFNDSLDRMFAAFRGIRFLVGEQMIPIIEEYATRAKEWFIAHREIIAQNLQVVLGAIFDAFKLLIQAVSVLVGWIQDLIGAMGGLDQVIRILKTAIGALITYKVILGLQAVLGLITATGGAFSMMALRAKAAAVATWALKAALFGGLFLILEDLYNFMTGGKSVFGLLLKRLGVSEDAVKNLGGSLKGFFASVIRGLGAILDLINAIAHGSEGMTEFIETVTGTSAAEGRRSRLQKARRVLTPEEQRTLAGRFSRIRERTLSGGGAFTAETRQSLLNELTARALRERQSQGGASSSVSVGEVKVEIQGSTGMGPDEVARATSRGVSDALDTQVRRLQESAEGGVL